jgi:hypothetical protein
LAREGPCEHIETLAKADQDGNRLGWQPLLAERAAQLQSEIEQCMEGEEVDREIGLRHAEGESVRQIARAIDRDPSSVSRKIPIAMQTARIRLLASLVEESLTMWNACVISMRSSKPLDRKRDAYAISLPGRRKSLRKRPDHVRLTAMIRQQRELVNLVADTGAAALDPHVACWYDAATKKWVVDFLIVCADRADASAVAKRNGIDVILNNCLGAHRSRLRSSRRLHARPVTPFT